MSPSVATLRALLPTLLLVLTISLLAGEPPAIENSNFFAESGWNREDAVIQVSSFYLQGNAALEITHEWAAGSRAHQLSYTIPVVTAEESGLGDVMLHYRYQLAGGADRRFGVAPRVSLILPTRSESVGVPSAGLEMALPLSVAVNDRLALNSNVNATWFRDRHETELKVTQSLVLALTKRAAFSVEAAYTRCGGPEHLLVVRPGIQWTFDAGPGLRVSSGLSVPIGESGVLLSIGLERTVSR